MLNNLKMSGITDSTGNEAIPIPMICEREGCKNHEGFDYIRKKSDIEIGWEDEPIFLCDKHSKGYERNKIKHS